MKKLLLAAAAVRFIAQLVEEHFEQCDRDARDRQIPAEARANAEPEVARNM